MRLSGDSKRSINPMKFEKIDLNNILKSMLPNYVNILIEERFNHNYILLCCINTGGNFIYICPNHYKVMGFKSEELLGVNGFEIIHPDDVEKMNDFVIELLQTKQPKEMIYRIQHKLGHWLTMQSICTPYIVDEEVVAVINFSNLDTK